MKTRSSGPSSRPPLSWVGGIPPSASRVDGAGRLQHQPDQHVAGGELDGEGAEQQQEPVGRHGAQAGDGQRASRRASGPPADGASPEQATAAASDATKTASGTQRLGPGWPKPHVTVEPPHQHDGDDHEQSGTSRPDVRPASRPTHSAARRPDALGQEARRGAPSGSGRSRRSRSAGSRASSSISSPVPVPRSTGVSRSWAATIAASPSARTRWDTADGLIPNASATSRWVTSDSRPRSTDTERSDRPVTRSSRSTSPALTSRRRPARARRRPRRRTPSGAAVAALALALARRLDRGAGGPPARAVLDPAAPRRAPSSLPSRCRAGCRTPAAAAPGPAAWPARPRRPSRRRPGTRRRR